MFVRKTLPIDLTTVLDTVDRPQTMNLNVVQQICGLSNCDFSHILNYETIVAPIPDLLRRHWKQFSFALLLEAAFPEVNLSFAPGKMLLLRSINNICLAIIEMVVSDLAIATSFPQMFEQCRTPSCSNVPATWPSAECNYNVYRKLYSTYNKLWITQDISNKELNIQELSTWVIKTSHSSWNK